MKDFTNYGLKNVSLNHEPHLQAKESEPQILELSDTESEKSFGQKSSKQVITADASTQDGKTYGYTESHDIRDISCRFTMGSKWWHYYLWGVFVGSLLLGIAIGVTYALTNPWSYVYNTRQWKKYKF